MFEILMGIPEMKELWDHLKTHKKNNALQGDERVLFKKLVKGLQFLATDPHYSGLQSHEIDQLSKRYGQKVFQSYLGQGKHAWRLFWVYGPDRKQITIIGLEPHPEDSKRGAYDRVKLSDLPKS